MMTMRRAGATSAATLIGLALTIVVAHAMAPKWLRAVGLDVWNYPVAVAANKEANQESQSLDAQHEQLCKEIELSDYVAEQVISGTLSLEAAVDELEPVLSHRCNFDRVMRIIYHAETFRQCVARYLIQ